MYCPEIHHNLSIHYVNNKVILGPCCIAKHTPVKNNRILDHQEIIFLRNENNQGKLTSTCNPCITSEKYGGSSRRLNQLDYYKNYQGGIRGLDIHLGNLCNLKCVICGPHDSTSWRQDWESLGFEIKEEWKYDKRDQYDINWLAQLKDLEMVHFWGGEPLMGDAHVNFLKELDNAGTLKNCRIQYNTNGTHTVSDEVLELWSQAHLVEIYFSIDDIDERFEYQRTNSKWKEVTENLLWFKHNLPNNHLLYVNTVWSYLNVYYLEELYDWLENNFYSNRFGDDNKFILHQAVGRCQLTSLTSKQHTALSKKLTRDIFRPILKQINISKNSNEQFIHYLKNLDNVRNLNYKDTHPEWGEILGV